MSGPSAAGSPGDGALCDEDPLEEDRDALDFDVAQLQQNTDDDMLDALHVTIPTYATASFLVVLFRHVFQSAPC